jgi:hypothetical protein
MDEEPGHRRETHRIPGDGALGYFAACLGGIGRPDVDRHAILMAEPLREADMVDVAVRRLSAIAGCSTWFLASRLCAIAAMPSARRP